jgi:hypothetical protein
MRKKPILRIIGCVFVSLIALVLFWTPSTPSGLLVEFKGYTNGTDATFVLTNPTSATLQLGSNCILMSDTWRPLGSVSLGSAAGKELSPHSSEKVVLAGPKAAIPWRAQFFAEPTGLRRRWHLLRIAAEKAGLPVRNAGMPSLGGPSEVIPSPP